MPATRAAGVFANTYEFTDATGDLPSCPAAALAGYSGMAGHAELARLFTVTIED